MIIQSKKGSLRKEEYHNRVRKSSSLIEVYQEKNQWKDLIENNSRYEKVALFFFHKALLMRGLDLFHIYKTHRFRYPKNAFRYKVYRKPILNFEEPIGIERSRKVWRLTVCSIITYLYFKFTFIHSIQVLYEEKDYFRNGDSIVLSLYHFVGNPLSNVQGIPSYVYTGTTFACLYQYWAYLYHRLCEPLNYVNLRFIFDPEREIKRIDLVIEEKIGNILTSLDFYIAYLIQNSSKYTNSIMMSNKFYNCNNWRSVDYVKDYLNEFMNNKELIRPSTFSVESYKRAKKTLIRYVAIHFSNPIIIIILGIPAFYIRICKLRCSQKILDNKSTSLDNNCYFFDQFNFQENIVLLEIIVISLLITLTINLNLVMIRAQIIAQFELIKILRTNLNNSLQDLIDKRHNISKIVYQNDRNYDKQESKVDATRSSLKEGKKNKKRSNIVLIPLSKGIEDYELVFEKSCNKILLKTLIEMYVIHNELKIGAYNITIILIAYIIDAFCLVVLWLLTYDKVSTIDNLKFEILFINWVQTNAIGLSCASMVTSINKLEKLCFQIWTEKLIDSNESRYRNYQNDFIFSLWGKFIRSLDLLRGSFVVKPFNIEFTFQNILSINFFILSLVAIFRF